MRPFVKIANLMSTMEKRRKPRLPAEAWISIRQRYELGVETIQAIAESQGITSAAIVVKARKAGWTRELADRVERRTNDLLSELMAQNTVATLAAKEDSDEQAVEAVAVLHARVSRQQLKRIAGAYDVYDKFRQELIDLQHYDLVSGRLYPLPIRVEMFEMLTKALERLVDVERRACGMEPTKGLNTDPPRSNLTQVAIFFPEGGPGRGHSTFTSSEADTDILPSNATGSSVHPEPV